MYSIADICMKNRVLTVLTWYNISNMNSIVDICMKNRVLTVLTWYNISNMNSIVDICMKNSCKLVDWLFCKVK